MRSQIPRINMIKQQLRTGNVLDESILSLYDVMPRQAFVPEKLQEVAYSDLQLPLDHNQCMMTPLEEATILQALAFKGHENVLEVGTGTGFFTALLSRVCAQVASVDCYPEFTEQARQNLKSHRCNNVTLVTGDASGGWMDGAPFDAVIYTGALPCLTDMHRLQVLPGGQLFAVIGKSPVMQGQHHTLDHNNTWQTQLLFETELPLLTHASEKTDTFVF